MVSKSPDYEFMGMALVRCDNAAKSVESETGRDFETGNFGLSGVGNDVLNMSPLEFCGFLVCIHNKTCCVTS